MSGRSEQLWAKPWETWFPDGLDTHGLAPIKVHAGTADFRDASTTRAKQLLAMRKAMMEDDPDGDRTVNL